MGKFTVFGLIWLLLFALALILIDEQLSVDEAQQASNDSQRKNHGVDDFQASDVVLQINGSLVDDFWERGTADLPMLVAEIYYVVENVGTVSANIVSVEIFLDSVYYSTRTVQNLLPSSEFTDSFSFSVNYDQSNLVEIRALSGNTSASWFCNVDAELPRHPSWRVSKLFITPDEMQIQSTYKKIFSKDLPFTFVHWIAIRDWVGRNIEYVVDSDSHGESEFWQLGRETLESQRGDCEDFAILLCSLLRTDEWSVDDVYVVIGQNEAGSYHAWVKIRIPLVGWYNIEPQLDGWNTLVGDFVALHDYTAIYSFNDRYFIDLR